jgi:GDP-L-fucose synthase
MDVVVGSEGFIGKAVSRKLKNGMHIPCSSSGYMKDCRDIADLIKGCDVDTLYLCACRTGGVGRMLQDPFSFVLPNVRIHMNVFEACRQRGVNRVVCVQSTTGYPNSPEPMKEEDYDSGELHPKYVPPGTAHRFIYNLSRMYDFDVLFFRPSNVYGPENNFDPQYSHVIEATVRKVAEKQNPFVIWGSGNETRDAIYIDDLVEAMTMDLPAGAYNVGSGEEMSVNQIVDTLFDHSGFRPEVQHDESKPTAIPARRVDCSKLRGFGWTPKVSMKEGLQKTYDWYLMKSHRG